MEVAYAHVTTYPHSHPHEEMAVSLELALGLILALLFAIMFGMVMRRESKRLAAAGNKELVSKQSIHDESNQKDRP